MEMNILIFILGLVVGSFLNVCIYRIPANKSIVKPRSQCQHCEKTIQWYDNIPLISYILLGGKCRYCKDPFSFRYFFVELFTGIAFLLINIFYLGPNIVSVTYTYLVCCLIVISFIDIDHYIIPDSITLPGIIIGLILSVIWIFTPQNNNIIITAPTILSFWAGKYISFINAIIGMFAGGGVLLIIGLIAKTIVKKEAMGGGDIKLLAFVGTFIGWKLVVLTLIFASIIGSIIGGIILIRLRLQSKETNLTGHYIPFGPYLALGSMISILWGNLIIDWYVHIVLGLANPGVLYTP